MRAEHQTTGGTLVFQLNQLDHEPGEFCLDITRDGAPESTLTKAEIEDLCAALDNWINPIPE